MMFVDAPLCCPRRDRSALHIVSNKSTEPPANLSAISSDARDDHSAPTSHVAHGNCPLRRRRVALTGRCLPYSDASSLTDAFQALGQRHTHTIASHRITASPPCSSDAYNGDRALMALGRPLPRADHQRIVARGPSPPSPLSSIAPPIDRLLPLPSPCRPTLASSPLSSLVHRFKVPFALSRSAAPLSPVRRGTTRRQYPATTSCVST